MSEPAFDPLMALRTLLDHEVRFVLIGGFAGALRGSPVITGDVVCELPMYTRNYVQEGGGIQLGKSDRKDRKSEAVTP